MHFARSLIVLGLVMAPSLAYADAKGPAHASLARVHRSKSVATAARLCTSPPVEVTTGPERATFPLTSCDGTALRLGVDKLSVLARPSTAPVPKQSIRALSKTRGPELAPGIRRLDPRLVERLERLVAHFRKDGRVPRVVLVSGYRPRSGRSYHQAGRALDLRIAGVSNEDLVAYCKKLPDTGCGFYPNGSFAHLDVRPEGAGRVSWIDASRPGDPPKYVSAWPLPARGAGKLPGLPAAAAAAPMVAPRATRSPHRYWF